MSTNKPRVRLHADGQMSVFIGDGFTNFMNGLGAANLKATGATYTMSFSHSELEVAYRTSTWFGKIVDIPADDSTREWRSWKLEDEDVQKIEDEERRLGLKSKVRQARIWQRLYGGSALILGVEGGSPDTEVPISSIRKGALKFVSVVPKHELTASEIRRNPLDPYYGLPEYYEIRTPTASVGNVKIHPSRVIPFRGTQVASTTFQNDFWGDSIWVRLEDAIKAADSSGAVLNALLQEAKVDVIRVSGMMKGMATEEYESLMLRRFQMVALLKGMQNVMLLDKDDEWDQKSVNWSGLPDVAKQLLNVLSGAANIPMFRLTGQNLTGLAGTGDAETRAYYDDVRADQNTDMRPTLDPLDQILVRSALGNYPNGLWYEWTSLYQMTEKEKAEIDKIDADTASVYATAGLVPLAALGKAVEARMIDSGRWPALKQALEEQPDEKEENEELDAKVAELLEKARAAQPGNPVAANQPDNPQGAGKKVVGIKDAEPRTLYVSRAVQNWKEIAAHFKGQGFKTTVGEEMHVTIVYSKTPVDWMKIGSAWDESLRVAPGGPRLMEAFGPEGQAKVMLFSSNDIEWRHRSAVENGASHDFDSYQPHITISYESDVDLKEVEPWTGPIIFGPEIFKEVKENWSEGLTEDHKPEE